MNKKVSILIIIAIAGFSVQAQTKGMLSVNVTTKGTEIQGKNYAPKNTMAIWVEDEAGNFVKTLLVNAQARVRNLDHWEASTKSYGSTFNTVDAVTGPTNNSHGIRSCAWDGTDSKGNLMPDGKYILHMELTDVETTGRMSEYAFTKGPQLMDISPEDQVSFVSVAITWKPD